jgi:hypothetical protein
MGNSTSIFPMKLGFALDSSKNFSLNRKYFDEFFNFLNYEIASRGGRERDIID